MHISGNSCDCVLCNTVQTEAMTMAHCCFLVCTWALRGAERHAEVGVAPSTGCARNYRSFEGQGWMAGLFHSMMMGRNWRMDASSWLHTGYKSWQRSSLDGGQLKKLQPLSVCSPQTWPYALIDAIQKLCNVRPSDVLWTDFLLFWLITYCL